MLKENMWKILDWEEKNFGCERCEDRFMPLSKLKKHLWYEHESFKIHDQCEKCGKKYIKWSQFEKHMNMNP